MFRVATINKLFFVIGAIFKNDIYEFVNAQKNVYTVMSIYLRNRI